MAITFNDYINGDKPVVVDFYAEWCAPCKTMQPILQEIKTLAGNTVTILKMDVDKNKFYADKFNIQSNGKYNLNLSLFINFILSVILSKFIISL